MVADAAAVVACTDVTAQQDTQAPVVNTELEIFESMHKLEIISQIGIHRVMTVIPTLELQQWIIGGNSVTKRTDDDGGDESPEWNESLNFGTRAWKYFTVSVWDEDDNPDDALSAAYTYYLPSSSVSRTFVRLNAYSGYVQFDYYFS